MSNPYVHLGNPRILSILVGNDSLGRYIFRDNMEIVEISMPRLYTQDIESIGKRYGVDPSRTLYSYSTEYSIDMAYLAVLINRCVETNRCPELLAFFFGKPYLTRMFRPHDEKSMSEAYETFREKMLVAINGVLWAFDCHLTCFEGRYCVTDNSHVKPDTPSIKVLDRDYIRKTADDAFSDLEAGRGDNAMTLARTLLEEVYCRMIEVKGETPNKDGKIKGLSKQVRKLYFDEDENGNIPDADLDKLMNGYNQVQLAIAESRNASGTAHGLGAFRIDLDDFFVRLYVNSSLTLAEFMLDAMNHTDMT